MSFGAAATSYHVSPMKGGGAGTHSLCLHKDLGKFIFIDLVVRTFYRP